MHASAHFSFYLICRVAQKVVRDLAIKKKVEIKYVDKAALERLSGNKPHQVGEIKINQLCTRGETIMSFEFFN